MNGSRILALASLGVIGVLGLAACGSSSDGATGATGDPGAQSSAQAGQTGQTGQPGQGSGFRFPGTVGKIAAVEGKTLQVQGSSGQTAVTYTGSTSITAQVDASLKDVKVGSCVTVTPTSSSSSSSSTVSAATVRIVAATNGSCTGGRAGAAGGAGGSGGFSGGFGGPGGSRPSGMPSFNPSDRPSGLGGGASGPGGAGGFRAITSGKVTAVTGSGFTVDATRIDIGSGSSPSATTSPVKVLVGSSTTYTTTQKAGSDALKVGKCVTALGSTNDTGAVTARTIAVSDPVSGSCTSGFGGFGGSGRG